MDFLEFELAIWVKSKSYSELWKYYFRREPWKTNFDKTYKTSNILDTFTDIELQNELLIIYIFVWIFILWNCDNVVCVPLNTNVSPLCQVKPASGSCRYSLTIDYHHVLPPHQLLLPKLSSTWTYPRKSRENIWDVFNRSKRLSLLIQPPDLMQGQGFSKFGKDQ